MTEYVFSRRLAGDGTIVSMQAKTSALAGEGVWVWFCVANESWDATDASRAAEKAMQIASTASDFDVISRVAFAARGYEAVGNFTLANRDEKELLRTWEALVRLATGDRSPAPSVAVNNHDTIRA